MAGRMCTYLSSSVGRKQIMGLSGLALCGFLLVHLMGNLSLMHSQEAFNTYAYKLTHLPIIIPMELGLMAVFLGHIFLALKLTWENKQARVDRYAVKVRSGRGATFASSTMPYTGLLILVFLILHLISFRFAHKTLITHNGIEMMDLYSLVIIYFHSPLTTAWYVFVHAAMGLHVSHGFASCFQSIGFRHPRYSCYIEALSKLYGVIIFVGFSTIAIWAYTTGGHL